MSEFSESHSVSKLIGSPPGYVGYSDNQNILEEIRNKPYSVLVLDELEKANPKVLDIFYQILDELKVKYDMSIILVSHDLDLVKKFADKVILLDKKIIKQGKAEEVFESPEFKERFGDF